jgi:hypothetical protein
MMTLAAKTGRQRHSQLKLKGRMTRTRHPLRELVDDMAASVQRALASATSCARQLARFHISSDKTALIGKNRSGIDWMAAYRHLFSVSVSAKLLAAGASAASGAWWRKNSVCQANAYSSGGSSIRASWCL